MALTGLHLLLTWRCDRECDHCFVWGSPEQSGTMTLSMIGRILRQAAELRTIEWIWFEGGEAFLYFPILTEAVRRAATDGFRVGVVTNGYWATSERDAEEWLRPLAGRVHDLSISKDPLHGTESDEVAARALRAARRLAMPANVISIAWPGDTDALPTTGQLPAGESVVMYRGRAAEKLAPRVTAKPWRQFTTCPCEDLREPERVHVDPSGHVHLCQGISLGNLLERSLADIFGSYDPEGDPVIGALLDGGPAELARRQRVRPREGYADACHLCYETRLALRQTFPDRLAPDAMYGVRRDERTGPVRSTAG